MALCEDDAVWGLFKRMRGELNSLTLLIGSQGIAGRCYSPKHQTLSPTVLERPGISCITSSL